MEINVWISHDAFGECATVAESDSGAKFSNDKIENMVEFNSCCSLLMEFVIVFALCKYLLYSLQLRSLIRIMKDLWMEWFTFEIIQQ